MLRDVKARSGTFIDATSSDVFYLDPLRGRSLGVAILSVTAGRNRNVTNSQYLRLSGNVPSNLNGFPLPYDAVLVGMTLSENLNTQTWTAEVRKNGLLVIEDSLTLINNYSISDFTKNTDFNKNDRIQIYMNGTGISYPGVSLFFRRRI